MRGVEGSPLGLTWCLADFEWFYSRLTLPDGQDNPGLEPFQRLILREIFVPDDGGRQWIGALARETDRRELLVVIPKGHAKTTLMAALAVFHLLTVHNANVYVGAANKIQAGEFYRFAQHFVTSEPEINAHIKVLEGTKEMKALRDQGFIRVLASDDSKEGGKGQGFNPTLAFLDELHAHENDNLYTDMRSGLFKRNGILATITTAGWNMEGVLGTLRSGFLEAGAHGGTVERYMTVLPDGTAAEGDRSRDRLTVCRKASGNSVMLEWALRPKRKPRAGEDPFDSQGDDYLDMEVVKLANPASWVSIASLRDALESLTLPRFKRYRCNLWTLAYEAWLPDDKWDGLYDPRVPAVTHRTWEDADDDELREHVATLYPAGTSIVGYIDMGRYRDCAALVVLGEVAEWVPDKLVPRALIWRGSLDRPVRYAPTKLAWRALDEFYELGAGGYDPKYYDQAAEELTDGEGEHRGIDVMELAPQSNERMCPAAANLRQAILTDEAFAHDGDPVLQAHVDAAILKNVGSDLVKLVKSKDNGPPIDGCIALAGALDLWGTNGRSMYEDGEVGI